MTKESILINTLGECQHSMEKLMSGEKLGITSVIQHQGYFKHVFNLAERTLERVPSIRSYNEDVAKAINGFESDCEKLFAEVKKDYVENPKLASASNNYWQMKEWMSTAAYKAERFKDIFDRY